MKIYTTGSCGDCWRAKRFLKANSIMFKEINIDDDAEAAALVMNHNGGKRRVPTFEIDGVFHGNPRLSKLAELLGIS